MNAEELFRIGRLNEAVEELTKEVKSSPADPRLRSFLFELLCFQGQFERAAKQLSALPSLTGKVEAELGSLLYSNLLQAERTRQAFFRGSALPKFFKSPPEYVQGYVLLVSQIAKDPSRAEELLAKAEEATPDFSGKAGEAAFLGFRDADDRVGPIFEVFQGSDYLWLPMEEVRRIQVSEPKNLRDLMWINARIETGWTHLDVFMPVLYPASAESAVEEVRLGRKTDWSLLNERLVTGMGQRVFLVDDEEIPLLQLRQAEFHPKTEEVGSRD